MIASYLLVGGLVVLNAIAASQHEPLAILALKDYSKWQLLLFAALFIHQSRKTIINLAESVEDLLMLTVLTGGMYIFRFAILDDTILLATVTGIVVSRISKLRSTGNMWFRRALSTTTAGLLFLAAMSVVGLLAFQEVRALRYFGISGSLILLYEEMRHKNVTLRWSSALDERLISAMAMYNLMYIANVVIISRSQILETALGIGGAGAGYQGLAYGLSAPSLFKRLFEGNITAKNIVTLISTIGITAASDSRYSYVVLVISFLFAASARPTRQSVAITAMTALIGLTGFAAFGFLVWGNPMLGITLFADTFSTFSTFGESHLITYYGTIAETASGDQGRLLLLLNAIYFLASNPFLIVSGAGTYGYVYLAYQSYPELLSKLNIIDNFVNSSATGSLPRPPSISSIVSDYGLIGIIFFAGLVKKQIAFAQSFAKPENKRRHMAIIANVLVFLMVGEQLDTVATYLVLLPISTTTME